MQFTHCSFKVHTLGEHLLDIYTDISQLIYSTGSTPQVHYTTPGPIVQYYVPLWSNVLPNVLPPNILPLRSNVLPLRSNVSLQFGSM